MTSDIANIVEYLHRGLKKGDRYIEAGTYVELYGEKFELKLKKLSPAIVKPNHEVNQNDSTGI